MDFLTKDNSRDIVDEEVFHQLPVQEQIKKLEEGYFSDPNIETRRTEVKRNLLITFEGINVCSETEENRKRKISDRNKRTLSLSDVLETDFDYFLRSPCSQQHLASDNLNEKVVPDAQSTVKGKSLKRDQLNIQTTKNPLYPSACSTELTNVVLLNDGNSPTEPNCNLNNIAVPSIDRNRLLEPNCNPNNTADDTESFTSAQDAIDQQYEWNARMPSDAQDMPRLNCDNITAVQTKELLNTTINKPMDTHENVVSAPGFMSPCLVADCNWHQGEISEVEWQNYLKDMATTSTVTTTTTTVAGQGANIVTMSYSTASQLQRMNSISSTTNIMDAGRRGTTTSIFQPPPNTPTELMPIYQILAQISTQIDAGNRKTDSLVNEVQLYNMQVSTLKQDIEEQFASITEATTHINKCEDKIEKLTNIVVSQEKDLKSLKNQLQDIAVQSNSNNLIIFGTTEVEDAKQAAKDFFKLKLEIEDEIAVENVYWRGKGKSRPMCVTLQNVKDKGLIYKNVKNLKGKKNEDGKSFNVTDDLPLELQEQQRKYRGMITRNKSNTASRITMSVKNQKLSVNNSTYKQQVPAPTPVELLQLTEHKLSLIQTKQLFTVEKVQERHNAYYAYACVTDKIAEIRAVYKHLSIKHAGATHIAMAHNLTGLTPELQDYDDHGEIGLGAKMLRYLIDEEAQNIAVFIVRYAGNNLGVRRFEIPLELLEQLILKVKDLENCSVSYIHPRTSRLKTPRKYSRIRGGVTAIQGGAFNGRGRTLHAPAQSLKANNLVNRFQPLATNTPQSTEFESESNPEVVIRSQEMLETEGKAAMERPHLSGLNSFHIKTFFELAKCALPCYST